MKLISTQEFGRKGITSTPWIGDVIIIFALSIVISFVTHFFFGESLSASFRTASTFFCVLSLLVIIAGLSVTKVYINDGIIKTWSLSNPFGKTFHVAQIATIDVKSNDWCRYNLILKMRDGKQQKISIKEVDKFIVLITSLMD